MVKRICPVCDQVMEHDHYCKHCKQFVKNPWVREVGYYLNERHPVSEHACTYHEDPYAADRLRGKNRRTSSNERYDGKRRTAVPQKKNKAGKVVLIIFLIYMMIQVVVPILFVLLQKYFWYWF